VGTVLAAVHHSADAASRVAATDQQAVLTAAADNRLYVPVRLLSDKYDIPHPYTPTPPTQRDALLAAYNTAAQTATCVISALDDLAIAVDAPSSLLAVARQAAAARPQSRRQRDQSPAAQPALLSPAPGRTEHALRKLHIHDPAMLLRAAVIDQAARDLIGEATAKADSRSTVTSPVRLAVPATGPVPEPPARTARRDLPTTPQAIQHADDRRISSVAPPVSRSRQSLGGARTAR
jgi:hypothetical protein